MMPPPRFQIWKPRFGAARDIRTPKSYDLTCFLPVDGPELIPSSICRSHIHLHLGQPAFIKFAFGLFLPSKQLGNSKSPESCSLCSKLNYIHQPGASAIVPRAFLALIRIFLFSLGEKGQPISASITLPGART